MGSVLAFKQQAIKRMVRLAFPEDCITNNTSGELHLRDVRGALIELLRPGFSYSSPTPVELYFEIEDRMSFRSYVNEAPDHDHVY